MSKTKTNTKVSQNEIDPQNDFVVALQQWLEKIRAGELTARISEEFPDEISELGQDINFVADMLQSLSRKAEIQLQEHTEHIARKNKSLETLYDVVTSINMSRDLRDLLIHFLHTMTELVNAQAAVVYLSSKENTCELVGEIGLDDSFKDKHPHAPNNIDNLPSNQSIPIELIDCPEDVCKEYFDEQKLSILIVPLQYRGNILGVYNIYLEKKKFTQEKDFHELFTSMGRHLGIAVEKERLDNETHSLSIMRERSNIANELHDSLAQTLASLRYQIRLLDESIHQEDEEATWQDLEKIENTAEEAHAELRALIAHFRIPTDQHSLTVSVDQIVERFQQDSDGMKVYLHKEWPNTNFPPQLELQVLRIIQEALTNVRKHSDANVVRVLMQGDNNGHYIVLIEDDGVGIPEVSKENGSGEHVGLSIMQDRASRIGGTLSIDAEPGEGTQIRLEFDYLPGAYEKSIQELI